MGVKKQVIIGNSAAGLSAISAIRRIDSSCPITVISAENYMAYSPVLLTYYIAQEIGRDDLFIADDRFYREHDVKTIFGNRAVGIDPAQQTVYLEDDTRLKYDNLLIATGALAKHLSGEGANLPGILTLRTIEDAEKLTRFSKRAQEIVILGAGQISLQVANALSLLKKGIKLTFVVGSSHLLSQNVDADCAAIIQRRLESQGVLFLFGRNARSFKEKGNKIWIVTDKGEDLATDLVVVGKGVTPNVDLVKGTGVKVNEGIIVDEHMRTNVENIFAAGDVAEAIHLISGKRQIIATWSNACIQGRIAGLNMAGYPERSNGGLNENITSIFGLTVATIGSAKSADGNLEELKYADDKREIYRKFLLADNRIVGAILLNKIGDAGIVRSLIKNRTDITPWKERMAKAQLNFGTELFSMIS
jgi:nitrite reductase (NADH) large subunit